MINKNSADLLNDINDLIYDYGKAKLLEIWKRNIPEVFADGTTVRNPEGLIGGKPDKDSGWVQCKDYPTQNIEIKPVSEEVFVSDIEFYRSLEKFPRAPEGAKINK